MVGFKFQLLPSWRSFKLKIPFNALAECGTQMPLVYGGEDHTFQRGNWVSSNFCTILFAVFVCRR